MHDYLGHHTSQEETEEADGKSKVRPVVPILHDLQRIGLEVYSAVEVHLVKRFHRYFTFAMVLCSI